MMDIDNFNKMKDNESRISVAILFEFFDYDQSAGRLHWKKIVPPNTLKVGTRAGSLHKLGYRIVRLMGKFYREHRIVWAMQTGSWPENFIDHVNGIRDDNRFENLRAVTESENSKNRRRGKNNKTGVNGVHVQDGKFIASIRVDGKGIYLGSFSTLEEAAKEREKAENYYKFHKNHGKEHNEIFK
jgi:hypothetical protein